MRWPFSGLFGQQSVKDSLDLRTVDFGFMPPPVTTLWAIRRTADMADLMLTIKGGTLENRAQGGRVLVGSNLVLTAWFRPQHGQERVLLADKAFAGLMFCHLSGWSRVVVKRPPSAPQELPFTAPDLLRALADWPLVLTNNAAPPAGQTGTLSMVGAVHGLDASTLEKASTQLITAGRKAGAKAAPAKSGRAKVGTIETATSFSAKQQAAMQTSADAAVAKAMAGMGVSAPAVIDAAYATFNQGAAESLVDFTLVEPPGKPRKPGLGATALELPNRLYLSPTSLERFRHRTVPFAAVGRTELWHSRLVLKTSDEPGGAEEASRDPAAVRPIWTPDLVDAEAGQKVPVGENDLFLAMTARHRSDLVHLGANYDTARNGVAGKWMPLPARVRRLELSALGGFMDLHGQWQGPLPKGVNVTTWKQRLSLGRDSRVEIVEAGVLAPFGHQAVRVTVTTREVRDVPDALLTNPAAAGADVAILVKRVYIAVTEPSKTFDAGVLPNAGRGLPFTRVDILTGVTQVASGVHYQYWPMVFGQNTPVSFAVRAQDAEKRTVRFTLPMAFVPIAQATNDKPAQPNGDACADFVKTYKIAPASLKHAALGRQVVCLAPDEPRDSLSMSVQEMAFDVEDFTGAEDKGGLHRFRPKVAGAKVEAPGAREFADGAKDVWVQYFDAYLTGGFGGANAGEVVLKLTTPLALFEPGAGASSEKAGPVATPRVAIQGYSRRTGAVTGDPTLVEGQPSALAQVAAATGTLDPKTLLPKMRLLGAFDLFELIGPIALPSVPGQAQLGEAMRLTRERTDAGEQAILAFQQPLKKFGQGLVFDPWDAESRLEIKAVAAVGSVGAPGAQTLDSAVRRFGVSFFGVVRIDFNRLSFTIKPGSKPDLDLVFADLDTDNRGPLTFTGDLAFVQQLADILPVSAFSDPPDLQITADGVVAGYSLGLPPIQLGALALSNIGFGARFQLPFLGDAPSLRLNFAERHSPFGVLVALLGGGGFFAVELDTKGLKSIEGTLEAQAGIAMNLGVAAGAVTARLGIYYRWQVTPDKTMTFEAFAELRGELCVLGLISASITFHVKLGVESTAAGKELIGEAKVTVEIELLFFSKSVKVTCRRSFQGSKGDPTFAEVYPMFALDAPSSFTPSQGVPVAEAPLPKAWMAYASAFA